MRSPLALGSVLVPFTLAAFAALSTAACSSSSHEQGASDAGGDSSSSEDSGLGCTNVTPSSCPTPEPSYSADVLPLIQTHCYECHADAGIDLAHSDMDLGSYDALYSERGDVLVQVGSCRMPPAMPPAGLPPPLAPTDAERATILGWLKCGAPND